MTYAIQSMAEITGQRMFWKDSYIDKDAYNAMSSAKTKLLLEHPFWGFMGLDLVLVETNPDISAHGATIKGGMTAATDGYHIFYSADFVNKLSAGEVIFLVAHEIYHVIWGHTGGVDNIHRGKDTVEDFNAKKWNYATDFFINNDLVKEKVGDKITKVDILYDEKYDGLSSEQIYELLDDDAGFSTLDIHVEYIEDDSIPEGEPKVSFEGGTVTIRMNPKDLEKEQERIQGIAQRAVAHVENSSNGAGSIPSHLRRLIKDIKKPRVSWKAATRQFITVIRKTGYSFIRPDKRTFGSSITLPGFRREDKNLNVAIAFDTSGSVGDHELPKFFGELKGILSAYRSHTVDIFCFEGTVDKATHKRIINGDAKNAHNEIMDYIKNHLSGGGGTNFKSVWDFMRKEKIKPRGLIFFTDGYPYSDDWHCESQYCPTLFVTVGNPTWVAPFGITVPYEAT